MQQQFSWLWRQRGKVSKCHLTLHEHSKVLQELVDSSLLSLGFMEEMLCLSVFWAEFSNVEGSREGALFASATVTLFEVISSVMLLPAVN